jgi:hypothetical protein
MALFYGCQEVEINMPKPQDLQEVSAEVVYFEFIPDTGNNTFRLRYAIKFTNPNDVAVNGFYEISTKADGLETKTLSSNTSACYRIEARSDCTFSFDAEDSFDLGRINTIEFVSVRYTIEK